MPIIPLTCPNCGGNLKVESAKDAAICEYCGKPFIVKDAVFNTYVNNVTNITADNFIAENVNIYSEKDFEIKAGILLKYNGESDNVVIPDAVKSIGERAFSKMSIVSVTIPNSVKSIQSGAFYGCTSLTDINMSEGMELIGESAFENCSSLTSIVLPNSITSINSSTFEDCSSLTSIVLPDSVSMIRDSAFKNCSSLTSIVIPISVSYIADNAFDNCSSLTNQTRLMILALKRKSKLKIPQFMN